MGSPPIRDTPVWVQTVTQLCCLHLQCGQTPLLACICHMGSPLVGNTSAWVPTEKLLHWLHLPHELMCCMSSPPIGDTSTLVPTEKQPHWPHLRVGQAWARCPSGIHPLGCELKCNCIGCISHLGRRGFATHRGHRRVGPN